MDIRLGYRIEILTNQPTPGLLLLDPHPSRDADVVSGPVQTITALTDGSPVPVSEYTDGFGNRCRRLVVPAGGAAFENRMTMCDSGEPDFVDRDAKEVFPGDLPSEVFEYMLSSRYCEVDGVVPCPGCLARSEAGRQATRSGITRH